MEVKRDPQIVAFEAVLSALQLLDEAGQQMVLGWVKQKLNLGHPSNHMGELKLDPGKSGDFSAGASGNLRDFLKEKNPSNDYQLLACLGYFLEHTRSVNSYKSEDLLAIVQEARRTVKDLPYKFRDAIHQYQFFVSNPDGTKSLSQRGEDLVLNLPDQQKAKEALGSMITGQKKAPKKGIVKKKEPK